jgi:4-hydroxyphenylpyruvate dioxygenase-like putative hemolysin
MKTSIATVSSRTVVSANRGVRIPLNDPAVVLPISENYYDDLAARFNLDNAPIRLAAQAHGRRQT